jgi:hypothetical protein
VVATVFYVLGCLCIVATMISCEDCGILFIGGFALIFFGMLLEIVFH